MAMQIDGFDGSLKVNDDGTIVITFGGALCDPSKKSLPPSVLTRADIAGAELVPSKGMTMAYLRLHVPGRTNADSFKPRSDPFTLQLKKPKDVEAARPVLDYLQGSTDRIPHEEHRTSKGQRADVAEAEDRMTLKMGLRRELRKLEQHLLPGERVEHTCSGRYGGNMGLVVLTDLRLMLVFHGVVRQRAEDFPINSISSVNVKSGMLMSALQVHVSGSVALIDQLAKADAKALSDRLRHRVMQKGQPHAASAARVTQSPPAPTSATGDALEQLERAARLRDSGVLSEEEFQAQKRRLLG